MEFNLKKLVRENIWNLKPYSSARDEFSSEAGIFLDANENPFGNLNRYPDPYQKELKKEISKIKSISDKYIFLGNGSDEIIDIIIRIFAEPKQDKILIFPPTYGMYEVSADINNVEIKILDLDKDFQISIDENLKNLIKEDSLKIIFVCSPNNPTGNLIHKESIEFLLNNFNGIIVIDEAYEDFAVVKSWKTEIENYPNLIVMQTFSKAWGMAGLRVGMAFTNEKIIGLMNKVKPPYNISLLNQNEVLKNIKNTETFDKNLKTIINEKENLEKILPNFSFVEKIYPSNANFILAKVQDADKLYNYLIEEKIVIRNRHKIVKNGVRISIGNPEENQNLISALEKFEKNKK
jgi:histidinol-phosphate aminotransferase